MHFGHHDHITCTSQPGQGKIFTVFLPANVTVEDANEYKPTWAKGIDGTETIFVVDDEEIIRDATKSILICRGYPVHCAASGYTAHAMENRIRKLMGPKAL